MLFLAIDGACRRNGKPDCLSAGAVFIRNDKGFVDSHLVSERGSTNQRGELLALKASLKIILESTDVDFYIITDSEYIYNAVTKEWHKNWVNKNWKTASDADVKNQDIWKPIAEMLDRIEQRDVELSVFHVKGHLMSLGKVTARNLIEEDSTGRSIYETLEGKYVEQAQKYVDKHDKALLTFEQNHGYTPPLATFKRFVLLNNTADLLAGYWADKIDSGDAAQ